MQTNENDIRHRFPTTFFFLPTIPLAGSLTNNTRWNPYVWIGTETLLITNNGSKISLRVPVLFQELYAELLGKCRMDLTQL